MGKKLIIDSEYLKEILDNKSSALVGKILKRFEIFERKEDIKKATKELIYEQFRSIQDILEAHDRGLDMDTFDFKTKKKLGDDSA